MREDLASPSAAIRPRALTRVLPLIAGLAAAAWGLWHFAVAVHDLYGALVIDDAYITFRYAENWANRYGPTWNPGEPPVEGYSTPLLMALLAAGGVAGIPVVSFAKAIGVASAVATLGMTGALAWCATRSLAWPLLAVGVLAANPVHAVWAVSGMETSLYTALVVGAGLGLASALAAPASCSRWGVVGVLLALLALTRSEGLLFAAGLGLLLVGERAEPLPARRVAAVLAAVAVVALVHLALRRWYYGLFLPLPMYEKGRPFAGVPIVTSFLAMYWVYLVPGAMAVLVERRGASAQALRFGAIALALLCVVVLNVDPVMSNWQRYHAPMLPFVVVAALVGLRHLGRLAPRLLLVPAVLAAVLVAHGEYAIGASREHLLGEVRDYDRWVTMGHVALGHWLAAHVPDRNATLALCDSGVVPYYSRLRVIDLWGLNDAYIARHGVEPDYVFGKRPELIVLSPMPPDEPLRHDPRLASDYVPVREFDSLYVLELYRRRDYTLR